jgi:hypothetical protein
MTSTIFIPVTGCIMLLISYTLCFRFAKSYWSRIILACSVFFLANILDYGVTVYGIINRKSQEGNPIIQKYIDYFGLEKGVLFHKLIIFNIIMFCVILLGFLYEREESKKLIPEYILYWGSLTTFIAVAIWLSLSS